MVQDFLEGFSKDLIFKGVHLKTQTDFQSHFVNWLNVQRIRRRERPKSKLEQNIEAGIGADKMALKLLGLDDKGGNGGKNNSSSIFRL